MAAGLWMVIMGLIFFYFVYLFKRFILGKSKDEIQLEDLEKEEMELITSNSIFKSKAKKEKQLKELRDKIELLNNKVNQHKNTDTSLTKAVYNHSKDVVSEIKPKINEYKEKYSSSNQINNIDILNEDELYEKIMIEIEEDKKVKSTWARALAQSDGDKDKAEAIYIKLRVNILMKEQKDTSHQALNLTLELNENSINTKIDSDNIKLAEQHKNKKSKFDSRKEEYLKNYENRKEGKIIYEEEPSPVGLFSYIKLIFKA